MQTKFFPPRFQNVDATGSPIVGTLTFYQTGTTTKITTYSDYDRQTANSNPITADSNGRFGPIFFAPADLTTGIKVEYRDAAGTLVFTDDRYDYNEPLAWSDISSLITAERIGAALYRRTDAEIAASITPSNYSYPGDDGPYIDIRRYGALVDGTTNDTAAVQAAIDVAEEAGGGQIFFPRGQTLITSVSSDTDSDIVLFGVSGSGYAGEDNKGSALVSSITSGDVITFGDGSTGKQNWEIRNLWISASTSGALLFLNRAPHCTLINTNLRNDFDGACFGIYAYESHHFAAYNSSILKKDNQRSTGSIAFRSSRDATLGGLSDFYNVRVRNWETGWSVGQHSGNAWSHVNRAFDGAAVWPNPNDDTNLNLHGCQGKSNGADLRLGSGCNGATIDGGYFEGGNSGFLRLTHGPRDVHVRGCMLNLGASSEGILAGDGTDTPESRYFYNIQLYGNWFRGVPAGVSAVTVNGHDADNSLVKIWDNDFELDTATSVGVELSNGDYVADVRRNVFTDPNSTNPTYCVLNGKIPLVWEQTDLSGTVGVHRYTNTEQLSAARQLTVNDPKIHTFTTDGSGRTVRLPLASASRGKEFVLTNFDASNNIVVKDSTDTETFVTLSGRTAGTPDSVQTALCFCDGSYWTVIPFGASYAVPKLAVT